MQARKIVSHSQDLAQCVNEVKRDNETLRQITNFQLSIENLVRGGVGRAKGVDPWAGDACLNLTLPTVQDQSLANYGRPKIDGELKIASVERRSKTDRWVEQSRT